MCPIIAERLQTGFRGVLYTLAKLMGDYNAVKKGKAGQRVGRRAAVESANGILEKLAQKSSVDNPWTLGKVDGQAVRQNTKIHS